MCTASSTVQLTNANPQLCTSFYARLYIIVWYGSSRIQPHDASPWLPHNKSSLILPSFGQVCLCAERVGMLWSQGLLTYIQDMTIHGFAVFLGLRKAGLKWITYHGGWCLRGEPPTSSWLMGHGHSETTVSVVL